MNQLKMLSYYDNLDNFNKLDEIIENIEEHREGEILFHISEKASEEQPDRYAHDEDDEGSCSEAL